MTEPDTAPATFDFGDSLGYEHRIGDGSCDDGWCNGQSYPRPCEQGSCGGLVHANFGDYDDNGDYWLRTECDVCGEAES